MQIQQLNFQRILPPPQLQSPTPQNGGGLLAMFRQMLKDNIRQTFGLGWWA